MKYERENTGPIRRGRCRAALVATALLSALVLVGCGTEGSDEVGGTTVTTTEEATTTAAVPSTEAEAATTTAAPTTPETVPPTTAAAPEALMPDVVCMNLQEAQDFIQSEAGVFYSRSEDATGAGRMQVIDSNWIVVAQRPDPGTPIDEGDAVLSAVKIGEPNDC